MDLNSYYETIEPLSKDQGYDRLMHYIAGKMLESHYIDEKLYEFLQIELNNYTDELDETIQALAEARALGDLSENEDYWYYRDVKECLEGYVHILKDYLSKTQRLTRHEALEFRKQCCSEYLQGEYGTDSILSSITGDNTWLEYRNFYGLFCSHFEYHSYMTPIENDENSAYKVLERMVYHINYIETYYTFMK